MQYRGIGRIIGMAGLGLTLLCGGCATHRLVEVRTYVDNNHNGKYDHVIVERCDDVLTFDDLGAYETKRNPLSQSEKKLGWEATEQEIRKSAALEPCDSNPPIELVFEKLNRKF